MKNKNFLGILGLLFSIMMLLTACGEDDSSTKAVTHHTQNIYNVKISKVKSDDGDFVVSGTTKAPDGSKILAQGETDKDQNKAEADDDVDYCKVKDHKFTARLTADNLTEKDIKQDLKIKVKICAVKKYDVDYDDYKITKKVRTALKSKVKTTVLTVDDKIATYYKKDDSSSDDNDSNDSDSSDEDSDSDSDEDDLSDEDTNDDSDSEDDVDDSDVDDTDDDIDDSDLDTDDEEEDEPEDDADEDSSDDQSADANSDSDKVYTGDSSQIIGDARTKKYHMPGQAGYYIDKKNVVIFNSEKEAQAQGYIKSKR